MIGDRATGWFQGMPITGKGTADTHEALLAFAGTQKIQRIWTDNSPELIQSCRLMKVVHDRSTPGRPQTNGRAERLVRKVLEGTRTSASGGLASAILAVRYDALLLHGERTCRC